jgi:diacylglycerol kinase family enzyme
MRAIVIHNRSSGFEQISKEELLNELRSHGYEAVYRSAKAEDFTSALREPGELVIVAGGDGTVGKVGKHLAGTGIPVGLYHSARRITSPGRWPPSAVMGGKPSPGCR